MADGLYSDIESYMEGEGDPVEKNVKNEGNIPQGNASPNAPRREGNIQSSDPSPEEPRREGNIERSGADPRGASRRGNIEQPDRQPQEPIRRPIEPSDEELDGERSSNIPISDNAPDPPQRTGNIQPRDVRPGDLQGEESIETNDRQPSEPRRRRNIRPDENNRPDNPNRVRREARDEAAPSENKNASRAASNNTQPQSPNRRVIRLREEAQPPSPQQEGNIEPTEEPPSTEPTESADISVGAGNQPPEEDTSRIEAEDRRPSPPRRQGNITEIEEDPQPKSPKRQGNIASEDSQPKPPSRTENINPDEERRPASPNRQENINAGEESRPDSPRRIENISPTEESEPKAPGRTENITPPEEPQPLNPNRSENISPTEEPEPKAPGREGNITPDEDERPPSPRRSENITPTEESEPKAPNRNENISPTEESEPKMPSRSENISPTEESEPKLSDSDGFIDPTEESEPKAPNRSENISSTEESEPPQPSQEDNISPTEESEPSSPQSEENITPPEEPQPQEPSASGNISPTEESEPQEPERSGNIPSTEESEPQSPQTSENIPPTEESEPQGPSQSGNITPPEESQPPQASQEGNISPTEESEPSSPQREENITPPEEPRPPAPDSDGGINPTEESEPSEPSTSGNITPTEESEPQEPDQDGAISPTEESEPSEPQREGNISPTEKSEPPSPDSDGFISPTEESEPSEPDQDGFISPTEESEPSEPSKEENITPTEESEPQEPDQDGAISPTEESEPSSPRLEGNIDPSDKETTDGTGTEPLSEPQKEGNIDPKNKEQTDGIGGEQLSQPQREGNIDPTDEETTDGIGAEKSNREQPLKFQPARFSSQIDPENEEFVDTVAGKGDAVPEWEPPLKYQPAEQFAGQISNEGEFVDVVAGSRDGVAEWETPLKYQPPIIRAKLESEIYIDPSDEGGRYQLQKFVAGPNEPGDDIRNMKYDVEGVSEPARHVKRFYRFALDNYIIDPSFEGGIYLSPKFVAGSNEPGDNIRNMIYDVGGGAESLRHQPENIRAKLRNGTVINPDDEGGRYQLEQFVTGSNEPGDNVRNMKYDARGGEAPLRHQPPEIVAKLQNGTIINPADEGGRQQSENFVAGSDEPGGNIRNMGYDFDGADAELRHQILYKTALDNGVIDPSFEGGIYLSPKFVVGSNEPGDQLPDFPVAPFNAESSHSTQNNGPVLNPAFDTGAPKEEEFVIQNERVSEIVDGAYPGSEDGTAEWEVPLRYQPDRFANQILQGGEFTEIVAGISDGVPEWETPLRHQSKRFADQIRSENSPFVEVVAGSEDAASEWEVPLRYQPKRFSNQINPEDGGVTDGVGGNFPRSSDGVIEANQQEQFQTRFRGEIEDLNRTVRLQQFNDSFGGGQNNLSLFDSPPTLQGNAGLAAEPFVLRRPVEGGGSSAVANLKQGDSRTAPVGSAAEDVVRMSKFFSTAKGLVYNVKQQFLQSQNPRTRTRLYDPTSPVQTAGSGMAVRPGQQITRHLSADSGPAGLVGDAASAIGDQVGFNVPQSSRYIDELNEEAINTPWGDMRGSLFWLSPAANQQLPEATGLDAVASFSQIQSGNVQNIKPLFSTEDKDQLSQFAAGQFASQGGFGNGYLFTNTYDPGGGPNGEGRKLTDNYHPSAPYIENVDSINSREEPTAEAHVGVQFNDLVQPLRDLTEEVRTQKESAFPFVNPFRTPETEDVVDGDGNVRTQIQNSSADDAYFENRAFNGEKIPMHRGVPQERQSRGLPNYSRENEGGQRTKRIDWINRLEPIVGEEADPNQETFGGGRHKDLIPFKFFDIENSGLIVFRAFLSSISDNLSPQWSQQDYAGRPEQAHIYGGYSNTISLSFDVVPFSEEEFEACWKKVNYLKGLTTPSSYSSGPGGNGSYMVPPFMRMTVGDLFNDVFGYMNSLTINFKDDVDWEIDQDVGRLPRGIEIDIDWQVIQKRAPRALQKFYDAPFLDEIDEVVTESPEPQPEILPQSADQPTTNADLDETRAEEFAEAPGEFSEPLGDGGPFERNANAFV